MTKEESDERERLYDNLNIAERELNSEIKISAALRGRVKQAENLVWTWVAIASFTALAFCVVATGLI